MSPYLISPLERRPFALEPLLDLADYQISQYGFLPAAEPLSTLPNPYFQQWEDLICNMPSLLKTERFHAEIRDLSVLSVAKLHREEEWRRAYVVLTFLTHAWIWGGGTPNEVLPPALAVPLLAVSKHLELPPVATFASLGLWNWQFSHDNIDHFEDSEALHMMHSLTGTEDESWFYLISVMCDGQGARGIPLMIDAIHAARNHDYDFVTEALRELKHIITSLGKIMERMYERCTPNVFYHEIRPLLAGSKNMAASGLPNGVYFDFGGGVGEWRQLRGGSNAQSSLLQFFDAVLGVVHESTGEVTKASGEITYHEEMRHYMPGPHRRFLAKIDLMANIRAFALATGSHPRQEELRLAFQSAVQALSDLRGTHMQMVARYIIVPSRQASMPGRLNLAVASPTNRRLTGTGGTDLIPFLKQTRAETDRAGALLPSK